MSRERAVCAVTFGVAAALTSGLVIGASMLATGDTSLDVRTVLTPLIWAAPSALAAALASRRLAAMPTAGGGGFVGAGVTVVAALLLLVGLYLGSAVATGSPAVLAELGVPLVWWITLAGAVALSPIGALAGWLAWRRIHRSDPTPP